MNKFFTVSHKNGEIDFEFMEKFISATEKNNYSRGGGVQREKIAAYRKAVFQGVLNKSDARQ